MKKQELLKWSKLALGALMVTEILTIAQRLSVESSINLRSWSFNGTNYQFEKNVVTETDPLIAFMVFIVIADITALFCSRKAAALVILAKIAGITSNFSLMHIARTVTLTANLWIQANSSINYNALGEISVFKDLQFNLLIALQLLQLIITFFHQKEGRDFLAFLFVVSTANSFTTLFVSEKFGYRSLTLIRSEFAFIITAVAAGALAHHYGKKATLAAVASTFLSIKSLAVLSMSTEAPLLEILAIVTALTLIGNGIAYVVSRFRSAGIVHRAAAVILIILISYSALSNSITSMEIINSELTRTEIGLRSSITTGINSTEFTLQSVNILPFPAETESLLWNICLTNLLIVESKDDTIQILQSTNITSMQHPNGKTIVASEDGFCISFSEQVSFTIQGTGNGVETSEGTIITPLTDQTPPF